MVKLHTRRLTKKDKEKIVRDAFDNLPEACLNLTCTKYDYKNFDFVFRDEDEEETHRVRLDDAILGLDIFIWLVDDGRLPGLGLPAHYLGDLGAWDAEAFDALLQCAIFGGVIYG